MPRPSIRRKLAVALAAPLVVLILITGFEVTQAAREVDRVAEQTELAKSAVGPSGIITALQNERTWIAVDLIGQADRVTVPVQGYSATRADTDAAVAAFRDEVARRGGVVADAYGPALATLDGADGAGGLAELRAEIDDDPAPRNLENMSRASELFDRYTALVEPFFDGTTRVALALDDTELRQGAELGDAAARQVETLSLLLNTTIFDTTVAAREDRDLSAEEVTAIAALHSGFRRYASILRNPGGPYAELAEDHYPEALTDRVDRHVDTAVATSRVDLAGLLADVDVPAHQGYGGYMAVLHARTTERADDLRSGAQDRQVRFMALAGLALAVTIGLTVQVSLSITRPLRSLTAEARDAARRRLPGAVRGVLETPLGDDIDVPEVQPVVVETDDEVADVVRALNTVQEAALGLAVEQAVLRRNIADSFVNLGRRNQQLLGRQLDFITEMESAETDPDTLGSLFRLDHLATRMRRNAESLLVLAGVAPSRRWAEPVRVRDAVRSALGEVEDFRRVVVTGVGPGSVLGSVAADLAHLVAELLENALTFSPPDHDVEVLGGLDPRGHGYVLMIVDTGIGMTPAELDKANRRLAGAESFTVAPSKYLGHYVAGRLAARHGIDLAMQPTPGRGVTAVARLPIGILTDTPPPGTATPAGGIPAVVAAGGLLHPPTPPPGTPALPSGSFGLVGPPSGSVGAAGSPPGLGSGSFGVAGPPSGSFGAAGPPSGSFGVAGSPPGLGSGSFGVAGSPSGSFGAAGPPSGPSPGSSGSTGSPRPPGSSVPGLPWAPASPAPWGSAGSPGPPDPSGEWHPFPGGAPAPASGEVPAVGSPGAAGVAPGWQPRPVAALQMTPAAIAGVDDHDDPAVPGPGGPGAGGPASGEVPAVEGLHDRRLSDIDRRLSRARVAALVHRPTDPA
jgi:signal transduction histidine kinase